MLDLTIDRDVLAGAVDTLAPAVVNSHAVCSMILLRQDGELTLQSTNYDSMIEVVAAIGLSNASGAVLVPFAPLAKLLPKLKGGSVTLQHDDSGLSVRCGRFSGVLGAADAVSWPVWDTQEASNPVQITPEVGEMIQKALKSTGNSDDAPWKGALHLNSIDPEMGWLEATNDERWTHFEVPELAGCPDLAIPASFLTGVLRSADGTLTLTSNRGQVYLADGNGRTWASTLIATPFPDTSVFVKRPFPYHLTLNRIEVLEVIERLQTIADDAFDPLVLDVAEVEGVYDVRLSLRGKSGELTEELDPISCDLPAAEQPWQQGLNPTKFSDLLRAFDGDEIRLEFGDNPLRPVRSATAAHLEQAMPRHLSREGIAARRGAA